MHLFPTHTLLMSHDHPLKIHCLADQRRGAFLTQEEAVKKAGESPDHSTRDLFEAIEKGDHPSWTCYIQEMTPEQAESFRSVAALS